MKRLFLVLFVVLAAGAVKAETYTEEDAAKFCEANSNCCKDGGPCFSPQCSSCALDKTAVAQQLAVFAFCRETPGCCRAEGTNQLVDLSLAGCKTKSQLGVVSSDQKSVDYKTVNRTPVELDAKSIKKNMGKKLFIVPKEVGEPVLVRGKDDKFGLTTIIEFQTEPYTPPVLSESAPPETPWYKKTWVWLTTIGVASAATVAGIYFANDTPPLFRTINKH